MDFEKEERDRERERWGEDYNLGQKLSVLQNSAFRINFIFKASHR